MVKPILVVMAAGMGSRYGGLKQIEPVGPGGEIILDYSVYDAIRAGFERVLFIIKKSIEQDFSACIDPGMRKNIQIDYAFQELEAIPESFNIPEGREKPWGTGQAILAAGDLIDAPFVVINADDYYGPQAFGLMYDHLSAALIPEDTYALCTWQLANTLSEHGHVSRVYARFQMIVICRKLSKLSRFTRLPMAENTALMMNGIGRSWLLPPRYQ